MRIWAPSSASSWGTLRCQKSSQIAMPMPTPSRDGRLARMSPAAKKRRSSNRPYVGRNTLRWTCRISPSSSSAAAMNSRWSADSSTNDDDGRQPARRPRERGQPRVVEAHRDLGGEVLEQVAGQAELGEDDQAGAARAAPRRCSSWWRARLSSRSPEPGRDLGEGDAERLHGRESSAPPCTVDGSARQRTATDRTTVLRRPVTRRRRHLRGAQRSRVGGTASRTRAAGATSRREASDPALTDRTASGDSGSQEEERSMTRQPRSVAPTCALAGRRRGIVLAMPCAAPATPAPTAAPHRSAADRAGRTAAAADAPAPLTGTRLPGRTGERAVDCRDRRRRDATPAVHGQPQEDHGADANTVVFTSAARTSRSCRRSRSARSPSTTRTTSRRTRRTRSDPRPSRTAPAPTSSSEWDTGDQHDFDANADYWGDAGQGAERSILRWSDEAAQRLTELQAGTVDGIDNPGPTTSRPSRATRTCKLVPARRR